MEGAVFRLAGGDTPIHRAEEEISPVAEADLSVGIAVGQTSEAAEIGDNAGVERSSFTLLRVVAGEELYPPLS